MAVKLYSQAQEQSINVRMLRPGLERTRAGLANMCGVEGVLPAGNHFAPLPLPLALATPRVPLCKPRG